MNINTLYYVLGILAFLYLASFSTYEHMTSKDVQKHQDHHQKGGSWNMNKKEPEDKKTEGLKGPKTQTLSDEDKQPKATHSSSKTKAEEYPRVYGPDVKTLPGHKDHKNSQHQDSHNPEPYDFVPAAEFPKGPAAPSPFLTDFSRIMK